MRILIATVTAGAGHVQAGAALEEAWRDLRPGDTVKRVDVLEYTPAPRVSWVGRTPPKTFAGR